MSELSKLPAGEEIDVLLCMTAKELVGGEEVDAGLYQLCLKIAEVYENTIGVEA